MIILSDIVIYKSGYKQSAKKGETMKSINTGLMTGNMDTGDAKGTRYEAVKAVSPDLAQSLEGGRVIRGEIIDLIGKNVKLQLTNGQQLSARLESAMELAIGQKAAFLVKSADSQRVTLQFVAQPGDGYMNAALDRALESAGLQFSERNREAVTALLENRLSINKSSIHHILAASVSNKNASFETLAQMMRYNIPINPVTSTQYEAYRNYEHQLTTQLDSLNDLLLEYTAEDRGTPDYVEKNINVLKLVLSDAAGQEVMDGKETPMDMHGASPHGETATLTGKDTIQTTVMADKSAAQTDGQMLSAGNRPTADGFQPEQSGLAEKGASHTQENDIPWLRKIYDALSNADISRPDVLHQAEAVFSSPHYREILSRTFMKGTLLKPEEITDKKSINDLYERLERKLSSLRDLSAKEASVSGRDLRQAADNLRSNIDFMKTLNEVFTYVQLPLQTREGKANGELYVYTRKKKPIADDGSVRVLLHLNMESLGKLDVHLVLKGETLASTFYTGDELSVRLLSENMTLLEKNLADKGYVMTGQVVLREPVKEHIKEFLSPEAGSTAEVKRYKFDIRA